MSRSTLLPTRKYPVEKHVFEQLEDAIDYGEVVKWHIIEEIADMPRLVHGIVDPKFAFMWMQVSQMLEGRGFFTTERGMNGEGFRVLQREEVASHNDKKVKQDIKQWERRVVGMSCVSRDGMSHDEQRKLDHIQNKVVMMAEVNKHLMRKRNLPMPGKALEAVKSL